MLTVIIDAFHAMKNISPTNNSQLSKTCLRIDVLQEKVNQTQHQLPKQRLRIAIEQLGNKTIEISLAVINDLEQIAHNHPQYHWIIMEILTTFVRENAFYMPQEELTSNLRPKVRADIQAALTVIARRDVNKDPENEQLDLSHTDMRGANLNRANLKQTNLYQANLAGANLREANLAGAILSAANLEGANLYLANLEGTILSAANLSGANLSGANLHRASLYLAGLHGAILNDATLDGANLREAKFSE
ncbi:MAG: pentapeptide repeat-containing protein [Nostoc sp. NOS(2021)]|uniref:pentapeptide repeat-containing protein n=1 Tax=Nostoc sp. NOS(2021) TaxID=2815407 RepID=UPI0025FE5859|nr:pentapeptide repeat-containing protein [Nostoc sp. NOS(2021)]MBN3898572.1 pentapeptide repeat-containing protein [Nostoc sp. NOS(2021)]